MKRLHQLFENYFHSSITMQESLSKAGSNRQYFRLFSANGHTAIGVIGQSLQENRSFLYLSAHFLKQGLPVPKIFAVSEDEICYLQEDLGTTSLYDALQQGRTKGNYSIQEQELIRQSIRLLPHIQVEGANKLDIEQLLAPCEFSSVSAMFDLNYFKYCFFRTTDIPYNEIQLEADLQKLAYDLCQTNDTTFLFRDFQARNIMLYSNNKPYIIDYQGGMSGPLQYDVASFLWQASARYPTNLREIMIEEYLDELSKLKTIDRKLFKDKLHLFVLFRTLQVLGAYGMRGYFEQKHYFINSIPPAIDNLRQLIIKGVAKAYPYLESLLSQLIALPKFSNNSLLSEKQSISNYENQGQLIVSVYSFSFKKGLPEDHSGNGGGYVFDCRSTHNPGRYKTYKTLTGLDPAVIHFLESDGEILSFLDNIYPLATHHVKRFIERGFTHVMFSFGCTGGRHRSVYCAQHLAEHLHNKYGVEVRLFHREQKISQIFARKRDFSSTNSFK